MQKLGKFDQLFIRTGEAVDGVNSYAPLVYTSPFVPEDAAPTAYCLIASGSYTGYQATSKQTNPGYKGMYVICDVYSLGVTGSLQLFVDIRNPCDGGYSAIFQTGNLSFTGTATAKKWLMYPGAVDTGSLLNSVNQLPVPYEWRMRASITEGSGTFVYSVGIQYAV